MDRVRLLRLLRHRGDLGLVEIQRLPEPPVRQRLRPDLPHLVRQLAEHVLRRRLHAAVDGQEPSRARVVTEELIVIGRAEEHAPPRIAPRAPSVGLAVDVVGLGQELLDSILLRAVQAVQLLELHDPRPLDHLARLLALERVETIIEPARPEIPQQRALADALRADQDGHGVILHARRHRSGDGRTEALAGDGSGVRRVRRAEVVDEERLEPRHAVPHGERREPVLHEIDAVHLAVEREAVHDALLAGDAVDLLHIAAQSGIVRILPVSPSPRGTPRELSCDVETVGERIEHDRAAEHRVVLEDDEDVLRRFQGLAGLGRERQTLHPAGSPGRRVAAFVRCAPERRRILPKSRGRLCIPLRIHESCHALILHRDTAHLHEARQLIGRGIGLCVLVELSEQMDAHEVERIAELSARGVGGVVTEQELAVVIEHRTARRGAAGISVAPLSGVGVLVGEIRCDDSRHVIHAAERAHRTGLLSRVLLGTAARDILRRHSRPA